MKALRKYFLIHQPAFSRKKIIGYCANGKCRVLVSRKKEKTISIE